jgi:hypothetical protein
MSNVEVSKDEGRRYVLATTSVERTLLVARDCLSTAWNGRVLRWQRSRTGAHADFLANLKRSAVGPAPSIRVPLVDLGLGYIIFLLPYTAV